MPSPTRHTHVNMKFLRTFLALVEERSTAKVSVRIGTAQSNVMQHVTNVERAVGAQLLERRIPSNQQEQGRTQLTEAGRQFLPKALAAMSAYDRLFDDAPIGNDPREASRIIALQLIENAIAALRHDISDEQLKRLYDNLIG